jgi:hypothetical protein
MIGVMYRNARVETNMSRRSVTCRGGTAVSLFIEVAYWL